MTLLHFDLRKPVRRTGLRSHFLQNSKIFKISNKIHTNSFQLMRFDDFLQNSKIFKISNKIYTNSFQLMRFDDKFLNC